MKYRRARQTAWRNIAGETVLLDLEKKRMYGLNPAAANLWQALEAVADRGELLCLTSGGGEPSFGEQEVAAFLAELLALGLVEERPPAAESPAAGEDGPGAGENASPAPLEALEPPAILWREDVEQIAGTCAMFPSQNPLCTQAPFS